MRNDDYSGRRQGTDGLVGGERYFEWLCGLVGRTYEYRRLLEELHRVEYYSLIPNDDNRGEDGLQLRDKFTDEEGPQALSQSQNNRCTVLEMLIGLSLRLEFETLQSRWEKTPSEWFWILIDNLGLEWCDNLAFEEHDICYTFETTIKKLLERGYESDGNGGLFPLKNPKKDQRKIEIWYQMSAYMLENYPI